MKKWALIGFILFLVISAIMLGGYFATRGKKDDKEVKIEKVKYDAIAKKTVATGTIIPKKEIEIKPRVSGVIDAIYVKAGDEIEVGAELAKIKLVPDALSINNAETQVRTAELNLQAAERELRRQEQVAGSGEDVLQAQIALREAEAELERQKPLFDEGLISQQAMNQFKADVDVKKAALTSAGTTSNRALDAYKNDVAMSKSQLRSAKNNLQLLKDGATKKSGGASNVIVSTVNGTVLDIPLKVGGSVIESNTFNAGTTIASVADMRNMIFSGKIDESEAGKIKEGMNIKLTIGALPDEEYFADLYYISPKGKLDEGTIKFDIEAAVKLSEDDFIRAGYSANAEIVLEKKEKVLIIPEAALTIKDDTTFIEIKTGENEFEKRSIETGISDGLNIEILSGLSEGDEVKLP